MLVQIYWIYCTIPNHVKLIHIHTYVSGSMQAETFAVASSFGSYPRQMGASSVPLLEPQVLHK